MTTWYEWNVKCATDGLFYKTITKTDIEPTVCPNNAAHSVVVGSGLIISKLSQPETRLNSTDDDGRIIVSPGLYSDFLNQYFTSESDDIANGLRGGGEKFMKSLANGSAETVTTEYRFIDYTQLLGGTIRVYGSNPDDTFSVDVYVTATPTTPNLTNTGNCNLLDLGGGANIILPANGNGACNVDLTSPENVNVGGGPLATSPVLITQAAPVPATKEDGSPEGYWNWSRLTGQITPAPNGDGGYNLYDFPMTLSKYVNKLSVYGGPGNYFKQDLLLNHRGGPCLPHWRIRTYCTRASSHATTDPPVVYTATFVVARKYST